MIKERLRALCMTIVLSLGIVLSMAVPAFAESHTYQHDPRLNQAAMADIIRDPSAVYGYRPDPASKNIGAYAEADWSDEAVVAKGRAERLAYHESIQGLYDMLEKLSKEGKSMEEIARAVSAERNRIRLESYKDDPNGLATVKKRNLEKYGNEEGPTVEYLYKKTGNWEDIIISAFSTNAGMDACLGIYDDYFERYIEMGMITGEEKVISHTIRKGETLCLIAERYYGDETGWRVIMNGNKKIVDRDLIYEGDVLRIPQK